MATEPQRHLHERQETVERPAYREGRKERAVKAYSISRESRYLLVQDVPALGAQKELLELFALYGEIEEYRLLDDYKAEQFTDVYWIKMKEMRAARVAKRKVDDHSFLGGLLHVSYAPEFESLEDTRAKLLDRRQAVAAKLAAHARASAGHGRGEGHRGGGGHRGHHGRGGGRAEAPPTVLSSANAPRVPVNVAAPPRVNPAPPVGPRMQPLVATGPPTVVPSVRIARPNEDSDGRETKRRRI